MTAPMHQTLALIIPTKDRPRQLERLLASIERQAYRPAQVVVVDGGDASIEPLLRAHAAFPIRYLRRRPPSLTRQKNAGIAAVEPGVSLVGFLDDDLVLEDGALEAMMAFWGRAPSAVGGAGFTIAGEDGRRGIWLKRWFALDDDVDGRLLPSGYNTSLGPQPGVSAVQWLRGGASVWRREVVDAFRFDEWFTGYGYLEDVDYSIRVARAYSFAMVADAQASHRSGPMGYRQHFNFGRWQITNRVYLARKHPELSLRWCLWALAGQGMLNGTVGVCRWGLKGAARALGNIAGWLQLAGGLVRMSGSPPSERGIKRRTARSFGYLWAQEASADTPELYHYRGLKSLLPPGHLRGRVLDAGSGSGIDALHLSQELRGQLVAVELSEHGAEQARSRTRGCRDVLVMRGDLERLPLRDAAFDFVYSYGVLHHLPHPEQGFRELIRVLRPGGLLAIYVYEDFATRSGGERMALALIGAVRRLTVRLPLPLLYRLCWLASPIVFLALTVPARLLSRWRMTAALGQRIPFRHGRSLFGLTGDLFDRFSAPIEQRYRRERLEEWFAEARLRDVHILPHRGWLAFGLKASMGGQRADAWQAERHDLAEMRNP